MSALYERCAAEVQWTPESGGAFDNPSATLEDAAPCQERVNIIPAAPARAPLERLAPTHHQLNLTRVGELIREVKPIPYLIKGILERDAIAALIAPPGTIKTFLAIDLGCSIATGTEWQGHRVNQGNVLYIAGEGREGLRKRFAGWAKSNNVNLEGRGFYISERAVPLNTRSGLDALLEAIEAHQVHPDLIIVDTLARNFRGDENSSKDMGAFMEALDELRRRTGATILILHHSGWGQTVRSRGSSALPGAVDREWIAKKHNHGLISLDCTKARDFETPQKIWLRLEQVHLGVFDLDGAEETTAVVCAASPARVQARKLGKNQQKAVSVLRHLSTDSRLASGRVPLDLWRDESGLNRNRFAETRDALAQHDLIEFDDSHVWLVALD